MVDSMLHFELFLPVALTSVTNVYRYVFWLRPGFFANSGCRLVSVQFGLTSIPAEVVLFVQVLEGTSDHDATYPYCPQLV